MDTIVKEKTLRNPEQDAHRYVKALTRVAEGHLLKALGSYDRAYGYVIEQNYNGNIRAWYDATGTLVGILMFSVGKPWWSDKNVVFEETVFCLDETYSGIQREAIRELERIARAHEAEAIFVGDIVSTGRVAKLVQNGYKKAGYQGITTEMVKVLKYE